MTDAALLDLAQAAGVASRWKNAFGHWQDVSPDTLRLVLGALDLRADNEAAIADSLARLRDPAAASLPPLLTADLHAPVTLAAPGGRWRLVLESGEVRTGSSTADGGNITLPPVGVAGYHGLELGAARTILAVAPEHCFGVRDAAAGGRLWGLAAQLYSLRRPGDGGIGDFAALREFVTHAGRSGASAVAISPIHAQFSADLDRFSPYSPSSRVMLNVLHGDVDDLLPDQDDAERAFEAQALVDWPGASRARLARFRRAWAILRQSPQHPAAAAFQSFLRAGGEVLERHARFEALHEHLFGQDHTKWNWRTWPEQYRHPSSPAVAQFAAEHADSVLFHSFLQFLADRGLASAQHAARAAGMAIGLIADLAVGTDGGGSHAWARQGETLIGLSVGAPPDILSVTGQDWGLAAFSPTGLIRHGFSAYLEMLRGALKHAGGVRIDHVMGLARLWVLPEGAPASQGAYLHFPLHDLLRLIALESTRHRAVILGEDLGTVPDGFQSELDRSRLMGLRVLWFEVEGERFRPPTRWTRDAAAMTSTHDLATIAGWWTGYDLDLRRPLGMLGDDTGTYYAYENRARDRDKLWDALTISGAVQGWVPPPDQPASVVDGAIRHIGGSNCDLALLPVEDMLGMVKQPNLPGTTDQHPNWRRRMAFGAADFFADTGVAARVHALAEARKPAGS